MLWACFSVWEVSYSMFCTNQSLPAEEAACLTWMKACSWMREVLNSQATAQIYKCLCLQSHLSDSHQVTFTAQMRVMRTHQTFCLTFYREGTTHGSILGHKLPCFIFVHNFTFIYPDGMQIKSNFKIMAGVNTFYERYMLYLELIWAVTKHSYCSIKWEWSN